MKVFGACARARALLQADEETVKQVAQGLRIGMRADQFQRLRLVKKSFQDAVGSLDVTYQ